MIIDYSIHSVLHQSISPSKKRTMEIAAIDINPVEIVTPEPSVPHTEVRDDVEHHPVNGHALLLDDVGEETFSKNNSTFKTSIDSGRRPANPGFPVEDEEFLDITHVDTYHADIDVPLSAKSGEFLSVFHDGKEKHIKVPSGGCQGQSIRVKMTRNDDQEEGAGMLCFAGMTLNEGEEEKPSVDSKDRKEEDKNAGIVKYDNFPCIRVDDDHTDIDIPLSAKSGDMLTVDHDGDEKLIRVPAGGYQGQSIRVKMTRSDEQVESTGILCFSGMSFNEEEKEKPSVYDNLPCTRVDDDHVDIQIPLSAKPGDIITVDHDGDKKVIKVPAGGCEGQSIRVKITRNY